MNIVKQSQCLFSRRSGPSDEEVRMAPAGVRLTLMRPLFTEGGNSMLHITIHNAVRVKLRTIYLAILHHFLWNSKIARFS